MCHLVDSETLSDIMRFVLKVKGELWKNGPCQVRKLFLEKKLSFTDIKSTYTFHMKNKI